MRAWNNQGAKLMDLKNKVAIVTGGGSGLGEATAIKLAEGGVKVAVLDLNGDAANAVAERIGGRAFAIDITDAEAGETTLATIASDLGTPRVLVNCAGVGTPMKILGKDGPASLTAFERDPALKSKFSFEPYAASTPLL
jgi:NAD(P)-dependent dehydrogenase (short-subunit alcohol dehydrogenase family)